MSGIAGTRKRQFSARDSGVLGPTARAGTQFAVPAGETRNGLLAVTCWCEQTVVLVPALDVSRGRTGSCGAHCHEPDDAPFTGVA